MKKFALMVVAVIAVAVSGCATQQQTRGDNALKTTSSWDVNRAVITAAERSGNYEIALKTGEEELKARPDNDEAKIVVARLLSRTGQPQRASVLLESIKDDPDGRVLIERVRSLIAMGMGGLARGLIDEPGEMGRIQGEENRFEANKLLAVAFDLEGEHRKAQRQYAELLAQHEDSAVRMNYGRSLIATGSYSQAAEMLMPLVESQKFPQARILAAGALNKSGDSRLARSLLEGYLSDRQIDELMKK